MRIENLRPQNVRAENESLKKSVRKNVSRKHDITKL